MDTGGRRRRRSSGGPAMGELRDYLHGPFIRSVAGIRDGSDIQIGFVRAPSTGGSAVEVDSDNKEIRLHSEDVACDADEEGYRRMGRLFNPLNVLYRKPAEGELLCILEPQDLGEPLLLYGDGGAKDTVPSALTDTNTVLSPPTGDLLLESRDGKAQLQSASAAAWAAATSAGAIELVSKAGQDITLNGSDAKVALLGDQTTGHTHSVVFALTCMGIPVAGTITVVTNTDTIATSNGPSRRVKAGNS